jgi:hypothetical protein
LALIENGDFLAAVEVWTAYRSTLPNGCDVCYFETSFPKQNNECCMCLESKLRTLSLYTRASSNFEHLLINAARKLEAFNKNQKHSSV